MFPCLQSFQGTGVVKRVWQADYDCVQISIREHLVKGSESVPWPKCGGESIESLLIQVAGRMDRCQRGDSDRFCVPFSWST
jgi:hypothetical protein